MFIVTITLSRPGIRKLLVQLYQLCSYVNKSENEKISACVILVNKTYY